MKAFPSACQDYNCIYERERERERESVCVPSSLVSEIFYSVCVCVCVCVCVSMRACTCTLCVLKTLRIYSHASGTKLSIANKKKFSKGCAQ